MTTKERTDMLWGIMEGYAHAKALGDMHLRGYYLGQWNMASKMLNISLASSWATIFVEMVTDGNINLKNVWEAITNERN